MPCSVCLNDCTLTLKGTVCTLSSISVSVLHQCTNHRYSFNWLFIVYVHIFKRMLSRFNNPKKFVNDESHA